MVLHNEFAGLDLSFRGTQFRTRLRIATCSASSTSLQWNYYRTRNLFMVGSLRQRNSWNTAVTVTTKRKKQIYLNNRSWRDNLTQFPRGSLTCGITYNNWPYWHESIFRKYRNLFTILDIEMGQYHNCWWQAQCSRVSSPWTSYQIRKIAGCACAGNSVNVFPAAEFKRNRWLVVPACIMARAPRTCRDACRDR